MARKSAGAGRKRHAAAVSEAASAGKEAGAGKNSKKKLLAVVGMLAVIAWYLFSRYVAKSQTGNMVFGFLLVFVIPGYAWGLTLIKTEDSTERFVLSVALSVSLVILSMVLMNMVLKIKITEVSVISNLVAISLAGIACWFLRARVKPG